MTEDELFRKLGLSFQRAGNQLFLVGGSVRDRALGRDSKDLDFTTDATPAEIESILAIWADDLWDVGRAFGTIAARHQGHDIEITTFRTDGPGRKPEVVFTDSLEEDLRRRDFTINAMALPVNEEGLGDMRDLVDPFGGFVHLVAQIIDTPRSPEQSFGDDPLRMLRAARFASQLDFEVASRVGNAMQGMSHRIDEISRERVAAELDKLIMGKHPKAGLFSLGASRLLERVLPGVSPFAEVGDSDDINVRWAKLLEDQKPVDVINLLRGLKMSSSRIGNVAALVDLTQHHQRTVEDEADARRVIHDAGVFLELLLDLWQDDDARKAVNAVLEREGVPVLPVSGKEIIQILNIRPGPIVGEAQQHLWTQVLNHGPMSKEDATQALVNWHATHGVDA